MPPEVVVDKIQEIVTELAKKNEPLFIADIGCGSGFFTIPILKKFYNKNISILALDISQEMLDLLKNNIKKAGLKETYLEETYGVLQLIKCEESFLPLADNSISIILMSNVFHEVENKIMYLQEIKRALKEGGYFILIDWKKEDSNPKMGPPNSERVSTDEALQLLASADFKHCNILPLYIPSFTIICKK
jgi:ubiquinone/menaquinone biosynthesis C-methylase UbiE